MKELEFIPCIDAADMPPEVTQELEDNGFSAFQGRIILSVYWENRKSKLLENWLISTYGDNIKQHNHFAMWGYG